MARLDMTPVPDLSDGIVADLAGPARRVARRRFWLRVALVVAALVQVGVGLPAVFGDSMAMAMAPHASHEMAAWNLGLGVAFLAAAIVPRRASGAVPVLATFLIVLATLSVRDLADGAVTGARLATHAAALVGLVLLVALDRTERAEPPGPRARRYGRQRNDDEGDTDLRSVA